MTDPQAPSSIPVPSGDDRPGQEGDAEEETTPVLLEKARPLSESILWKAQRGYYDRSGPVAWASGDVPFQLTSGPLLARAYARVMAGFVEDCLAGRFGPIDPAEPIYVVELGSGSGRLGYLCADALEHLDTGGLRVVYVLTDPVEKNIGFWANHVKHRPLIEAGRVDYARYEAGSKEPLHLEHSGIDLQPGSVVNPMIAVANYLFDVIPQDAYAVIGDQLYEELVEVVATSDKVDAGSDDFFNQAYVSPWYRPVDKPRYSAGIAAVLEEVGSARAGESRRFLFPATGLGALERFIEMSSGRLLFLIAERAPQELAPVDDELVARVKANSKAATTLRRLGSPPPPPTAGADTAYHPGIQYFMGIHGGSISLPVDLDILARAVRRHGGEMLFSGGAALAVSVSAIVVGDHGEGREVRERFASNVIEPSPDDLFFEIRVALANEDAPLEAVLATLRLSGYDSLTFVPCLARLFKLLPAERADLNEETVRVLERILALDYPYEDTGDIAGAIYSVMAHLGRYEEALERFLEWRESHGPRADIAFNMAVCHLGLDDLAAAEADVAEALELNPDYLPAVELRQKMLAAQDGDPQAE